MSPFIGRARCAYRLSRATRPVAGTHGECAGDAGPGGVRQGGDDYSRLASEQYGRPPTSSAFRPQLCSDSCSSAAVKESRAGANTCSSVPARRVGDRPTSWAPGDQRRTSARAARPWRRTAPARPPAEVRQHPALLAPCARLADSERGRATATDRRHRRTRRRRHGGTPKASERTPVERGARGVRLSGRRDPHRTRRPGRRAACRERS